jgi:hypothetical protein
MTEEMAAKKQCFTSIESRKLLGGMESFHLCPSMDLVVFGSSTSSTQNLYRTVSWQKVAAINVEEAETQPQQQTTTATCWSPNGRWIAVARDSLVSLHGVEPLANPPGGASFGSSSSAPTEAQHSWHTQHPVIGLSWSHVGRHHPTAWRASTEEEEDDVFWRYVHFVSFIIFLNYLSTSHSTLYFTVADSIFVFCL